ncbi:MAG TPA: hypothetical protein V6C81_29500 [Planktothrix sp.]|jgi:hypothetical protein
MNEVHAANDGGQSNTAGSDQHVWASVAADVRTDPQFNKKLADAKGMVSEFDGIFNQLDKDHNGSISSTEIDAALNDPQLAGHAQLLNFMKKDYTTLAKLDQDNDATLGITKDAIDSLPTVLDPASSKSAAIKHGVEGALFGGVGGATLGVVGANVATMDSIETAGWLAVPIGTVSLPVMAGVAAVAALGLGSYMAYTGYHTQLNFYDQSRSQLYSDIT